MHALKKAFIATNPDRDFTAELEKINFADLGPIDGDAVLGLLEGAMKTPCSIIERYNQIEKASG